MADTQTGVKYHVLPALGSSKVVISQTQIAGMRATERRERERKKEKASPAEPLSTGHILPFTRAAMGTGCQQEMELGACAVLGFDTALSNCGRKQKVDRGTPAVGASSPFLCLRGQGVWRDLEKLVEDTTPTRGDDCRAVAGGGGGGVLFVLSLCLGARVCVCAGTAAAAVCSTRRPCLSVEAVCVYVSRLDVYCLSVLAMVFPAHILPKP